MNAYQERVLQLLSDREAIQDHGVRTMVDAVALAAELLEEVEKIREPAARWEALISCSRIRSIGSTGLHREDSKQLGVRIPPTYAHLGVEMWTNYPYGDLEKEDCSYTVGLLDKFTNIAMEAQKEKS